MEMFTRTIHSDFSGHTLFVRQIGYDEIPAHIDCQSYPTIYAVHNFDAGGVVFMYLGKGNKGAPKEIVAWYAKSGANWHSFGTSIKAAIEGAQKSGWLYA
jgi:hypothetical protein